MADTVVHIGENSPEHVARQMTHEILFNIEHKDWRGVSREEYLHTIAQCLKALGRPHGPVAR